MAEKWTSMYKSILISGVVMLLCLSVTHTAEKREVPGVDYPALHTVPETDFSCSDRVPGYYADDSPISRCQVFHYCYPDGTLSSFLCPNTTIFNQRYFVCDYFHNFDCSTAKDFYNMNEMFFSQGDTEESDYYDYDYEDTEAHSESKPKSDDYGYSETKTKSSEDTYS